MSPQKVAPSRSGIYVSIAIAITLIAIGAGSYLVIQDREELLESKKRVEAMIKEQTRARAAAKQAPTIANADSQSPTAAKSDSSGSIFGGLASVLSAGSSDSVVGKWKIDWAAKTGTLLGEETETVEFLKDGTFVVGCEACGGTIGAPTRAAFFTGTYSKIDDGRIEAESPFGRYTARVEGERLTLHLHNSGRDAVYKKIR